ncbi:uncharacterized protein Pyn_28575 [Prunus yedoensis var. nudiflora]|uniref:AB hydrolase-1 domain-containing protein n=1 Tax=Prunus yedoensis var. nudiflora TaxID=2094558 RepID=A0A314Y8Y5_PRUYE|nr:uncharacterized protein Pyn_28575 [Prunus yedoensis var. nudiflora]
MPFLTPHSDIRSLTALGSDRWCFSPITWSDRKPELSRVCARQRRTASNGVALDLKNRKDPRLSICTADELHYASVPKSEWSLALWRYLPSSKAEPRNHPLLLLSGLATNAIGYDLSPESSFARYMSAQGYDTWILEVRGSGLSTYGMDLGEVKQPLNAMSKQTRSSVKHERKTGAFANSEMSLNGPYNMGFKSKAFKYHWRGSTSSSHKVCGLPRAFSTTLENFQKQLDLIVKFDWDFDHYLEEDLPVAMEYIRTRCKPKDGKLLAIGHSMGGILLYAMLSKCSFQGRDSGLASVATLGSSLDYTRSRSSLNLFLPLADPAQVLNVPVPFGALLAAVHHLATRTHVLSWLKPQVSAQDMQPELYEKLVLNNFCTVPTKLLLQLATAFQEGGLCDRSRTFFYKDHLCNSNVPILALGGDQDLICPLEAIYETVKVIPEELVTFKVLGEASGPHYAHYDLVGGRLAVDTVYPHIIEFLNRHDRK